jgi:hypothetical protein
MVLWKRHRNGGAVTVGPAFEIVGTSFQSAIFLSELPESLSELPTLCGGSDGSLPTATALSLLSLAQRSRQIGQNTAGLQITEF